MNYITLLRQGLHLLFDQEFVVQEFLLPHLRFGVQFLMCWNLTILAFKLVFHTSSVIWVSGKVQVINNFMGYNALDKWAGSYEFVSSSIPSWQILTAHAQPFRGARDLVFCLTVPLESLLVWVSSGGSGETARMRRLAWTFAARISDKYQIRLTRSKWCDVTVDTNIQIESFFKFYCFCWNLLLSSVSNLLSVCIIKDNHYSVSTLFLECFWFYFQMQLDTMWTLVSGEI